MEPSTEEDVKEQFFEACGELELGQLVSSVTFHLQDGMSAVEVLEPKMDVGMHRHKKGLGLQDCVEKGIYEGSLGDQLALMDATFCMFVAYLEGSAIAQTIWTNVMIPQVNEVDHEIYTVFSHGIVHLTSACRHIIRTSYCFEEEDFNALLPYRVKSHWTRTETMKQIRQVVSKLKKIDQRVRPKARVSSKKELDPAELEKKKMSDSYLGISVRLDFIYEMLEVLALLTPSQKSANEPYNQEEDDDVYDEDEEESEEQDFSPRFHEADKVINRLLIVVKAMFDTVSLGTQAPNGIDGNFGWLLGIEPDLNYKTMPPSFPRKVKIPNRKEAYDFLFEMVKRLVEIICDAPTTATNMHQMFEKAHDFSFRSCLLTRAILQLVMFPVDEHLYGNPELTMSHVIEATIRDKYAPLVTIQESPVVGDPLCTAYYTTFIKGISRLTLDLYQSFGNNQPRVMDKLIGHMEEFQCMLSQARKVDARSQEIVSNLSNCDVKAYNSASTFVVDVLIHNIIYIFELGFASDLYVPYEYFYLHWYIGDVVHRWHVTVFEQSQDMLIQAWKLKFAVPSSNNSRRNQQKRVAEDTLRTKIMSTQHMIRYYSAISQICYGIVRASVVLAKRGDLKIPIWDDQTEKLRYELRMRPFAFIGQPFYENYESFLELSHLKELAEKPIEELLDIASAAFASAKETFEELGRIENCGVDCVTFATLAKANLVVLRLLKRPEMASKKVEWVPVPEYFKMYPTLKFV